MSANWSGMLVVILVINGLAYGIIFPSLFLMLFLVNESYCLGPELVNPIVICYCSGILGKQVWAACRDLL